ncbi:Holliday junction branch migration protein RuvA [Candidatus Uhrbacteria bacterium]|nr:Holliday junction branch migration protein RuvA [Candidatus Uhrbacteria bacterium]
MISFIRGTIIAVDGDSLILENTGIGYEIAAPKTLLGELSAGAVLGLWTHEYIREDSRELYGFRTREELDFFKKLISISGVGPKMAMRLFDLGKLVDIKKAISSGRAEFLSEAQGVGGKTAQKIILELRGKIEFDEAGGSDDVVDALVRLGYSKQEAKGAIGKISPSLSASEARLREALKLLGRRA